jgi:hypothetical protein
MIWGNKEKDKEGKVADFIKSTFYDLTHLEINTIIKEDMNCSKLPDSPREILHLIATQYDKEINRLGKIYEKVLPTGTSNPDYYKRTTKGSGEKSFFELRENARKWKEKLSSNTDKSEDFEINQEEMKKDIKMLERIEVVSNDIYQLLKSPDVTKGNEIDFDEESGIDAFREQVKVEKEKSELKLDLRQYALIKKALDIGTETVVLQTIIGIDGDVTSRISRSFADNPISFINEIHHDAINTSVKFWNSLVDIVFGIGKAIFGGK